MIGKIVKGMAKGILGAASLKSSGQKSQNSVNFQVSGMKYAEDGTRISNFSNKTAPTTKQTKKVNPPKALDTTDLTSTIVGAVKSYGGRQTTNFGKQAADKVKNETGIQDVTGISPHLNNNFVIMGRQISYITDALIQNDNRINDLELNIDRKFHKATSLILNTTSGLIKSVQEDFYSQKALLHEIEDKVNLHDEQIDKLESRVDYLESKEREPQKKAEDNQQVKISQEDKEELTKQASDGILGGIISGFGGAISASIFSASAGLGFGAVGAIIAAYAAKKVAEGIMDGISDAKNAVGDWLSKKSTDVESWFAEKKKQLSDIFDSGVKAGDPYKGRGGKFEPDFSKNRKPYLMDKPAVVPEPPPPIENKQSEETKSIQSETDINFTSNKDIFLTAKRDIRIKAEKIIFDAKNIEFIGEVTGAKSGRSGSSPSSTPQAPPNLKSDQPEQSSPNYSSPGGMSATNPNAMPPPLSMEDMERLSRSLPGNMTFNDAPDGARIGRRRIGGYTYDGGVNGGPSEDPVASTSSVSQNKENVKILDESMKNFPIPEVGKPMGANRFSRYKGDPTPKLKSITTPYGKISVDESSAVAFKGFFEDLNKSGAPLKRLGSYNRRKKRWGGGWSEHAFGNAVDFDDEVFFSKQFKKWATENPGVYDKLKEKWGIVQPLPGKDPAHHEFGGRITKEAYDQLYEELGDKGLPKTPEVKETDEIVPLKNRGITFGMRKNTEEKKFAPPMKLGGPTDRDIEESKKERPYKIDRSKFKEELKDPKVMEAFMGRMHKEVGGQGPEAQQAFAEEVFNRATSRGMTIYQAVKGNDGYYPDRNPGRSRNPKYLDAVTKALEGSDISKGATGNASANVGFGRRGFQTFKSNGERFGHEEVDVLKGWGKKYEASKIYLDQERKNIPQLAEANKMADKSRERRLNPNMFSIKKPTVDPRKLKGPESKEPQIARYEQKANPSGGITGGDRVKKEPPATQTASGGGDSSGGNGYTQISNPRNSECDSVPPSPGDDGAGDYRPCLI